MISRASISAFNHLPLSEADEGDGLDADAEDEDVDGQEVGTQPTPASVSMTTAAVSTLRMELPRSIV